MPTTLLLVCGVPGFSDLPTDLWNGASQLLDIFQERGKAFECILYIYPLLTHYQATKKTQKGIKTFITLIELLNTWFHQFPTLNSEFSQILFVNYFFLFYQTILIGLKNRENSVSVIGNS